MARRWPPAPRELRRAGLAALAVVALLVCVAAATVDERDDDDRVASPSLLLAAFNELSTQRTAVQSAIDAGYGSSADPAAQAATLAQAAAAYPALGAELDRLASLNGPGARAQALAGLADELALQGPLLQQIAETMASGGFWTISADCGAERLDADIRLAVATQRLADVYDASFLLLRKPDARAETLVRRARCDLALEQFAGGLDAVSAADQLSVIPLLIEEHRTTVQRLDALPAGPADPALERLDRALRAVTALEVADLQLQADGLSGRLDPGEASARRAAAQPALDAARSELTAAIVAAGQRA